MRAPAIFISVFVAAILTATCLRAETLKTSAELAKSEAFAGYLNGLTRNLLLLDYLPAMDRTYRQPCNQRYTFKTLRVLILQPIVITPNSKTPEAGAWVERLSVERCGRVSVMNVMFEARVKAQPKLTATTPGLTMTTPGLAGEALKRALPLAVNIVRSHGADTTKCDRAFVVDTSGPTVIGDPNRTVDRAWSEIWTIDICGAQASVKISFTERGTTGTDFVVSPN